MKVLTDIKLWAYCLWHEYEPTTEIEGWLYESARSIAVAVLIIGRWSLVMCFDGDSFRSSLRFFIHWVAIPVDDIYCRTVISVAF